MLKKIVFFIALGGLLVIGCAPDREDEIHLPPTPEDPQFSAEFVPGDSNRVIIKDLSEGNFQRLWTLPGAAPKTSTKEIDTIQYGKLGEYVITLFVSKSDGSGTPSASKKINIVKDAPLSCNPKLALLTGDCGPGGKCWTFSHAAGAVKVGPTYDDFSWYTSPVEGLQAAQYDDGFCFTFENVVFQYKNNGATVNPWNGYKAEAYDPGISEFILQEGTGISGRDQIILTDDQFMGVWDSDNVLDIISLTATELVVRARTCAQDGTPNTNPEGWFELTFIPQ